MANENLHKDSDIPTSSETIEVLHNRVSVRTFNFEPVHEAQV